MIRTIIHAVRRLLEPVPPIPPPPPPLGPNDSIDPRQVRADLYTAMRREAVSHLTRDLEMLRSTHRGGRR